MLICACMRTTVPMVMRTRAVKANSPAASDATLVLHTRAQAYTLAATRTYVHFAIDGRGEQYKAK